MKKTFFVLTLTLALILLFAGCRGVLPDGTLPLSGVITITNGHATNAYTVKISEPADRTTPIVIAGRDTAIEIQPGGSYDFDVSWLGCAAGESQFVDLITYSNPDATGQNGDGSLEVIDGQTEPYDLTTYLW